MTKKSIQLFVILVLSILSSCSTVKFYADYNEDTNFKEYKTYTKIIWNTENDSVVNSITKGKVLSAITRELSSRNISESKLNGDISVSINFIRKDKIGTSSYTDYGGYYGYGYYRPMGYSTTTYYNYTYTEGAIVIDVFDEKSKKLIWQGTAKQSFNTDESPDLTTEKINYVIQKIFLKYPITPTKN